MKIRFWLLTGLILLIINLVWIWRLDQLDKENTLRMNDSRNRFIQTNRELYLMNRGWQFTMRTNDLPLPAELAVQQQNGITTNLKNYFGDSKKLILVLSDRHCSSCVDQLLFTVKSEIPEISRNNLLILYSMQGSGREIWTRRHQILAGVEFLEIPDKALNLPMDSLGIPYFFVSGEEKVASLAFTPYPSLEAQTKEYLYMIKKRYFN
jgi:hypothetical protein